MGKTRAECSQNAYTSAFLGHWIQIFANSSPNLTFSIKKKKKKRPWFFRILRSVGRGQHNKFFFWPYEHTLKDFVHAITRERAWVQRILLHDSILALILFQIQKNYLHCYTSLNKILYAYLFLLIASLCISFIISCTFIVASVNFFSSIPFSLAFLEYHAICTSFK